ncbi:MAG: PorP/SprF family type IX secretion system membrane protein [Bacteroidales bacterium]|nr:PorP/SprF family type IX secretion system membrane protein [Bacteroidales bacterium]
MRKNFLLILAAIICTAQRSTYAQDPVFSQFFFNPVYLNPAYAGASKSVRLGTVFKSQWTTLNLPYSTIGVSYDQGLPQFNAVGNRGKRATNKMGVGVNVVSDVEGKGTFARTSVDLVYSYGIQPSYNSNIRFGLQTSAMMRNRNYTNLTFLDMVDQTGSIVGTSGLTGHTSFNFDVGVGVVGDWENLYGGVAVHHILQLREGKSEYSYVPRKYTIHIGADINLYSWYRFKERLILSPNIIFIQQGRDHNLLHLGAYISHKYIVAGLWYRNNLNFKGHAFMATVGYADDGIRVGYSYDFSILSHGLKGFPTSSHEVTVGWNFAYKKSKRRYRSIKCPKF